MSRFLNSRLKDLSAYTPGEQPKKKVLAKLNTNESPYPPGPQVINAVNEAVTGMLNLYPSPTQDMLKEAIGDYIAKEAELTVGLKKENVFVSNGSDDIINFAFMAFAGGDTKAYYPDITYGFYEVFANFQGVNGVKIPLKEDFTMDIDDYIGAGGDERKLIVIANPNAPTGIAISLGEIETIVKNNPNSVVLVDEAYVDFGCETAAKLVNEYDNLLVSRTFSKFASLAGARLGFALGNEALIDDLEKIKYANNPYSINRMTEAVGLAAIKEMGYYKENCRIISETREITSNQLEMMGFKVLPSKANFLFVGTKENAREDSPWSDISGEELYNRLRDRGVLVRWFNMDRIRNWLRITIGRPEEMDILMELLKDMC